MTNEMVKSNTGNFRFIAQILSHYTTRKKARCGVRAYFFQMLQPFKSKILALLIQLPSSLTTKECMKMLDVLIHMLDLKLRYAICIENGLYISKAFSGVFDFF